MIHLRYAYYQFWLRICYQEKRIAEYVLVKPVIQSTHEFYFSLTLELNTFLWLAGAILLSCEN